MTILQPTRICAFPECGRPFWAKDHCVGHYRQMAENRPLAPIRVKTTAVCRFEDCGLPFSAKGYCSTHYQQFADGQEVRAIFKPAVGCNFDGCKLPHSQLGYCSRHAYQLGRGKGLSVLRKPGRNICLMEGCSEFNSAHGYCSTHAAQIKEGRPLKLIPIRGLWKVAKNGYVARSVNGKTEYQHRVVMEQSLGRPLVGQENVHHLNGQKDDNRTENLELWSRSQPYGQRVQDKADWAIEILRLYRPEALAKISLQIVPKMAA